MRITDARAADVDQAVRCLVAAFAQDPITRFLLGSARGYDDRLTQFFSLLMRARIALQMPVLVAGDDSGIHGAAMGYATTHRAWPVDLADAWDRFEQATPGLTDRMAVYDGIAAAHKPTRPHYYLGVIGADPRLHGRGIGRQLLHAFCELSARDPRSDGVYLETASASSVGFYEHAGFEVTGRGVLGSATLWCMYRSTAASGSLPAASVDMG
jgi:ribosomal protein S18 acetylase RimI-like enzyme